MGALPSAEPPAAAASASASPPSRYRRAARKGSSPSNYANADLSDDEDDTGIDKVPAVVVVAEGRGKGKGGKKGRGGAPAAGLGDEDGEGDGDGDGGSGPPAPPQFADEERIIQEDTDRFHKEVLAARGQLKDLRRKLEVSEGGSGLS
jgi:hypothetical protein